MTITSNHMFINASEMQLITFKRHDEGADPHLNFKSVQGI